MTLKEQHDSLLNQLVKVKKVLKDYGGRLSESEQKEKENYAALKKELYLCLHLMDLHFVAHEKAEQAVKNLKAQAQNNFDKLEKEPAK